MHVPKACNMLKKCVSVTENLIVTSLKEIKQVKYNFTVSTAPSRTMRYQFYFESTLTQITRNLFNFI